MIRLRVIMACAAVALSPTAALALQPGDERMPVDRLNAAGSASRRDLSALNAVGVVWTDGLGSAAVGRFASTAFLIDRCHVLTSLHVVHRGQAAIEDANGRAVSFGVGQTAASADRGAVQGLKFVYHGWVVGHGPTAVSGHEVADPGADWAMIRLSTLVDDSIEPLHLPSRPAGPPEPHVRIASAGFPRDHRALRGEGFKLKQLWESEGEVIEIVATGAGTAGIESTLQTTPGDSGAPVYVESDGQRELVGIVQGSRGDGVARSGGQTNFQLLFTPETLAAIFMLTRTAPCSEPRLTDDVATGLPFDRETVPAAALGPASADARERRWGLRSWTPEAAAGRRVAPDAVAGSQTYRGGNGAARPPWP